MNKLLKSFDSPLGKVSGATATQLLPSSGKYPATSTGIFNNLPHVYLETTTSTLSNSDFQSAHGTAGLRGGVHNATREASQKFHLSLVPGTVFRAKQHPLLMFCWDGTKQNSIAFLFWELTYFTLPPSLHLPFIFSIAFITF